MNIGRPPQEKGEFAALQLKSAVKVVVVVSSYPDIDQTSPRAALVDAECVRQPGLADGHAAVIVGAWQEVSCSMQDANSSHG